MGPPDEGVPDVARQLRRSRPDLAPRQMQGDGEGRQFGQPGVGRQDVEARGNRGRQPWRDGEVGPHQVTARAPTVEERLAKWPVIAAILGLLAAASIAGGSHLSALHP